MPEVKEVIKEKEAIVNDVKQRLEQSRGVIFTEYRGLTVQEITELRRNLGQINANYKVYKNTLVKRALKDNANYESLAAMLEGPVAIAFAKDDIVTLAKALKEYAKVSAALVIKGGMLENEVLDAKNAMELADIAPKEVLLARLAGDLSAPLSNFLSLMQAVIIKPLYALKALEEKKES
jgi:large subunit ribosomal protein L10